MRKPQHVTAQKQAQGGFHSATQPLVVLWANTFASSSSRATVHSFMGQGESIGEVIGGISLGAVAEAASVPTAMTCSAVLFVGAAVLATTARSQWTAGRRSRGVVVNSS